MMYMLCTSISDWC